MAVADRFLYKNAEVTIWKIEESADFFEDATGLQSFIKSDKRRLEYYAGRYVLQHMIPQLNLDTIKVSAIGKPYLPDYSFQFSISHSYPYIAVAIHPTEDVGIDIQMYREKILRLQSKFLNAHETKLIQQNVEEITLLWNAKEALFKWRGTGGQDFSEQLNILEINREAADKYLLKCQVKDDEQIFHPVTLFGKTTQEYALAIAVGTKKSDIAFR